MPSGVMQGNIANVRHWAEQVEIDWFTHFIKAWILFNAWYQNAFEEDGDRRVLNALKSGADNPLRAAAVRLLVREDEDALSFKSQLAQLHTRLEEREMLNRGRRITFTDCFIGENPTSRSRVNVASTGRSSPWSVASGAPPTPRTPTTKRKLPARSWRATNSNSSYYSTATTRMICGRNSLFPRCAWSGRAICWLATAASALT